jgi:small-conductance mechanosensitive channel
VKVPNRKIFESVTTIFTHYGIRRVDVRVGVSYGEDLERVQQIIKEAMTNIKGMVDSKAVEVVYNEFGDSSIDCMVRFWVHYTGNLIMYLPAAKQSLKLKKPLMKMMW